MTDTIHHTRIVEVNGAKITVGARDGWSSIHIQRVLTALAIAMDFNRLTDLPGRLQTEIRTFTDMVVLTEKVEGDLGFPWPSSADSEAEILQAFEAVRDKLNAKDVLVWHDAIIDLEYGPGDDEIKPGVDEKN